MFNLDKADKNIVLAPFTTYKIGGPADHFFVAKSKQDLVLSVIYARKNNIPYFVLGTGANILIGDKGFRGLVIKNEVKNISLKDTFLTCGSGQTIEELIQFTKDKNLSGLEHFAGIPSSVGGALWQNLHFLSPDRKDTVYIESVLESAEILNTDNNLQIVTKDYFKFGYDYSILHDKEIIVTEATFLLNEKEKSQIEYQINENLKWRFEKQPQLNDFPSCGSVFKKIEGVGAGRLIEKVGLKGFTIGGAQVSEKHANYIVNNGGATSTDVIQIINKIKEKIKKETNYNLETEINFIGEF